jgi:TPR repeat protein
MASLLKIIPADIANQTNAMNKLTPTLIASFFMSISVLSADDQPNLEALRSHAAAGDSNAQLDLAIRYRDGKGVAKDDAESLAWAHRAADQGNADAMDFVGFTYLRGAVVKRRPEVAFGYFKAAANESGQAAFDLGQCYFGAQGTEQDCEKALEWWKKAAEMGNGRAAACAAMAYRSGEGVAPDAVQARRLAERAAELNDPSGLVFLGELHFQAGELDAAKATWIKASKLFPTGLTGHPSQPSGNGSAQQAADLLKLMDYRKRQGLRMGY